MSVNPATPLPRIDRERCTGCGRCVAACPEGLLSLEISGYRKHAAITTHERCTRCMGCGEECPVGAIHTGTV